MLLRDAQVEELGYIGPRIALLPGRSFAKEMAMKAQAAQEIDKNQTTGSAGVKTRCHGENSLQYAEFAKKTAGFWSRKTATA